MAKIPEAEFAFSIYQSGGEESIDAYLIGDVLRALNLNPTLALIEKMGGTKKKGEKKITVAEFLPIYSQVGWPRKICNAYTHVSLLRAMPFAFNFFCLVIFLKMRNSLIKFKDWKVFKKRT